MMNTLLILTIINAGLAISPDSGAKSNRQDPDSELRISIIYDNYAHDRNMQTDWGFSALLEFGGNRVLFDTGTDGEILLSNADHLGLKLSQMEHLFLSHEHGDHTGGLEAFFGRLDEHVRPHCWIIPSFSGPMKESIRERCQVIESSSWNEIVEGVYTTGEIAGPVNEQAIVVNTGDGIVVLTGCAHPGIVKIVESAKEHFGSEVLHVIGGFHLGGQPVSSLERIVSEFRRIGVRNVTPTHCTGDEAIALFRSEYGEGYQPAGTGAVIVIQHRR
ncbi:MBL fold metallo-hydrolase [Gemmatimonadota bacterium]